MDSPYTNREIQEFFNDIKDALIRIENQTTRTNGRVSKLENWKSYSSGALAVIIMIVVPVLGWTLYQVIELLKK